MLTQRKLIWYLYPPYMLIVVIALLAALLYTSTSLKQFYLRQTEQQLEAHAQLFRMLLAEKLRAETHLPSFSFAPNDEPRADAEIDAFCKLVGEQLRIRLTVVLASGRVIGDSMETPANMDNHADRPEIHAALSKHIGESTRYSYTLEEAMMYIGIPVSTEQGVWGVVRASTSVSAMQHTLNALYKKIVMGGSVVFLFAALMSFFVAYRINKPIAEIKQGALRFANGDLSHRLYISGAQEITLLADAMNQMAAQLAERLDMVTKQRNELETVLRSMIEAVVVVDSDEHILRYNQAADRLFGLNGKPAAQRHLQEIVRSAGIQQFVKRTLSSATPVEDMIVLHGEPEQFLNAHGTLLHSSAGDIIGALLVFHDLTRLKHLENLRREFVANVSHELKTPITSISGFVETLQSGAINEPENAARFLEIIARNTKRLDAIIEDLLALSRIEQEEEKGQLPLTPGSLKAMLEAAMLICGKKAQEKNITFELSCAEHLNARMNADLLEQAVVNLLDNAIKYSQPQSRIMVRATQAEQHISIAVEDSGCGISSEHLPRLFERFYRVDKARSRKLGGTGLGLAIVKHIVQAHQGAISVESTIGKGSAFTITLPVA